MMFSFKIVSCILHLVVFAEKLLRAYGCLEASDYWHRDRCNCIYVVWWLFGGHMDFADNSSCPMMISLKF
jgi:hypothetical protein